MRLSKKDIDEMLFQLDEYDRRISQIINAEYRTADEQNELETLKAKRKSIRRILFNAN